MDSPLLIALSLGVLFSLFAPFVISQQNVNPESPPPPVFSPPPPPPLFSPRPPPRPKSPAPPHPPPSPPFPRHFRPPRTRIHRRLPPPPPPKDKAQAGLIVGIVFLVIAFLMQIGVVAYLVIKRRQLLKD